MNRPVFYCKSWFRAEKQPTELWSVERARKAHASKRLYCALVGSIEKPFCFLEITDGFVGVGFLDAQLREYLSYSFREIAPNELFLDMVVHREFEGDTDKVTEGTSYIFKPDGSIKALKERFNPHEMEEATSKADPSANYDRWPEFGEYDSLIRVERE